MGRSSEQELSLRRAEDTLALLKSHGPSGSPRAFEVWFVHVSGQNPALSKALKARGFVFVGPTTMYATMQACGLVDDHLADCEVPVRESA